jgi:hypothetical protein
MEPGRLAIALILVLLLTAGCLRLPGIPVISDTPDPIVGQWIGGEPPQSDLHVVFYDNRTFYSLNSFIGRGVAAETGTWTKIERGSYSTQSVNGVITNWTYDATDDSVYVGNLPQQKYFRYRG